MSQRPEDKIQDLQRQLDIAVMARARTLIDLGILANRVADFNAKPWWQRVWITLRRTV